MRLEGNYIRGHEFDWDVSRSRRYVAVDSRGDL